METGSQTSRLLSALVSVLIVSSDAQAASLTLGCTGTVTTSIVPKKGVIPDPDKNNVSDYSVVVDLDRHAVFGFWFETPTTGNDCRADWVANYAGRRYRHHLFCGQEETEHDKRVYLRLS